MSKSWFKITNEGAGKPVRIDLNSEIGFWGITANQFIAQVKALGAIAEIHLHINSVGGDVFQGVAIMNFLRSHAATVTVFIDGLAASIASVIAMAGNKVVMPANTFLMIHNPAFSLQGEADDLRHYADVLDKIKAAIVGSYKLKSSKSEEEIAAAMDAETWLSASEAKDWGLADEVTPAMQIAARVDLTRFTNMPEGAKIWAAEAEAVETEEDKKRKSEDAEAQAKKDAAAAAEAAKEKAASDERERCEMITQLCALAGKPKLAVAFINKKTAVADVRAKLLADRAKEDEALEVDGGNDKAHITDGAAPWGAIVAKQNETNERHRGGASRK